MSLIKILQSSMHEIGHGLIVRHVGTISYHNLYGLFKLLHVCQLHVLCIVCSIFCRKNKRNLNCLLCLFGNYMVKKFFSGKEKIVWHRDEKFLKQQQWHLSPNKPTAEKTHASKLLAYRGEICRQKVLLGKNVTVSIKTSKYFFGSVFALKCKGISVTPTVLCSNLANF